MNVKIWNYPGIRKGDKLPRMRNTSPVIVAIVLFSFGGIAYAQTATVSCCFPSGGGVGCEEWSERECSAANGTAYSSCNQCWENYERKQEESQPKVSCCFPSGGGVGCEQWTQRECSSRNGTVYNSCQQCWDTYEREQEESQPKISCCFPVGGGGVGCEQWTQRECSSRNGKVYNSCQPCWDDYERKQQKTSSSQSRNSSLAPVAGYEDEVLVNFDAYRNPFPDTSMDSISGKAAAELYRRGVIGGFSDGQFKGSRNVNRAEAAKFLLLARYSSVDEVNNSGKFPDVLDGQWYTKFVVTAANKGIIKGHPDGTFRPADTVNTVELLKMLSLTFDLPENLPQTFDDVSSKDWFAAYAGIAQRYNLFPKRTHNLSPASLLTREEVAVAIYQYLQQK